jgi:alkylated DNA nucleotide flippase Atl1
MLTTDLDIDEDAEQAYASLVHTLGNLTLTGYNSTLSNSAFQTKRDKLATSGLAMNQEIAAHDRWSRPQILARSQALAERAIDLWPGPIDAPDTTASGLWPVMNQALAELPAGSWTTYGDLAVLIGSHPVPVGMRLASHPAPNAHRVLQAAGTVAPNFRWLDPRRTDDPVDLLSQEGVIFDEVGHADPAQRVTAEELAELIGLSTDGLQVVPDPAAGQDADRRDQFVDRLSTANDPSTVAGVLLLLDRWVEDGGTLEYGSAAQTTCFLVARAGGHPDRSIWPIALYPSGKAEVVFQYLANRTPFDDLALREELRRRLNAVPGIDLPASKLQMRPAFNLDVLAAPSNRTAVADCLAWFMAAAAPIAADRTLATS